MTRMLLKNLIFVFFFMGSAVGAIEPCHRALSSAEVQFTENVVSAERFEISEEEIFKETGVRRAVEITALETKGGARFSERDIFGDEADLIIGIDVMGNTQGHTYMVVRGVRVDGRMFYAPHTEVKENWTLSQGLVIRYRRLPSANRKALFEWLESEKLIKTPTCVVAACKVLFEEAGFENPPEKNFWFPSKLLKHLLKTGLVGDSGERVYPEIYSLNRDVRAIWNNLPDWKAVPSFLLKVLFDPYTWEGFRKKKNLPQSTEP